jgi:hypothetical protein
VLLSAKKEKEKKIKGSENAVMTILLQIQYENGICKTGMKLCISVSITLGEHNTII